MECFIPFPNFMAKLEAYEWPPNSFNLFRDAKLYILTRNKYRNETSVYMKAYLRIPNVCYKAKIPID